jgi:hypothetical protein
MQCSAPAGLQPGGQGINEFALAELVHNITAAATQKPNFAINSASLFDDIEFPSFQP